MMLENLALLSRRSRLIVALVVLALVGGAVWTAAHFLQPAAPRHIVLASGLEDGLFHQYAKRYVEILARSGVAVEERITAGAEENLRLLEDPHSGVDIGFTQGGIARSPEANDVVMLSSLYYVPMWIFYNDTDTFNHVNELRNHRIAVGVEGSGTRSLVESVFALNDLTAENVTMLPLGNDAALRALKSDEVDAAVFVDGAQNRAVWAALHDAHLRLMTYGHAGAYPRLPPYIKKLMLPFFEESGEFPGTTRVDLRISTDADQHKRFGPSLLYRYLPFWLATLAERAIIILVPLAAVLLPLFHYMPQLLRWRVRSRVYRWYGELSLLERDVAERTGALPAEKWLADLERIERAVARIHIPSGYASEAYTLREHISLVRRTVLARTRSHHAAAVTAD